jgi:hypothetical protein
MNDSVRRWQLLAVAALAPAGVAVGHGVEYVLLAPHDHGRAELLARTGHHYLPIGVRFAAFFALVALGAVFLSSLVRVSRGADGRALVLRSARMLPAAQAAAFMVLEVAERLAAHASMGDLGTVLFLGLPLQLLVGFVAMLVVGAVERSGQRAGARLRGRARRPARGGASWQPVPSARPVLGRWSPATPVRGPPALART